MGYVFVSSACIGCGKLFSYHPNKVPSIRIRNGKFDPTGSREPICADCIARINPARIANGLEPIVPKRGAYEPCDENEMDWEN